MQQLSGKCVRKMHIKDTLSSVLYSWVSNKHCSTAAMFTNFFNVDIFLSSQFEICAYLYTLKCKNQTKNSLWGSATPAKVPNWVFTASWIPQKKISKLIYLYKI